MEEDLRRSHFAVVVQPPCRQGLPQIFMCERRTPLQPTSESVPHCCPATCDSLGISGSFQIQSLICSSRISGRAFVFTVADGADQRSTVTESFCQCKARKTSYCNFKKHRIKGVPRQLRVGSSLPIMLEGCRCASRPMPMRAEFHPLPARVLAMATVSGTEISAHLSRECAAIAASGGGISYRRTSFLPSQRISALRSTAAVTKRASGFNISRTLRIASGRAAGSSNVRSDASSARKETQLEQTGDQTESTYNTSKDVLRSDANWTVFKGGALQRLAGIFVGSALLVVSLGVGFTRPALARAPSPSTVETSSNVLNEEAAESDSDETTTETVVQASESESTPSQESQPTKEEERDPAELVLLSYLERHPEDMKALEGLMYIRLRKGSVAKALETVDNLLELRPDHAPWQLIRAQSLEFLGDLEQARHAFELILEKEPLSARALQGLATVMSKAGEGTEMLEMLQRAVQTAMEAGKTKEAKNLRMLLGQMYTLQGNLQEALAQYQELEREDPRDFRPYLCQGLVFSLLNQKADAERAFLKYRRRCPKSFPERGYLDDLMIGAKTEARKIQAGERTQPKGKKKAKPLQQPNIVTAVAENFDEE